MYTQFRQRFLALAQQKNFDLISFAQPTGLGPQDEKLFTDYAIYHGPSSHPETLPTVVHLSGLHGVEGYFGSLLQQKILESLSSLDLNKLHCRLIFVHAVNPYGMAWSRRTNAANVDLNRNCWPSDQPIINQDFLKFEKFLSALEGQNLFTQVLEFAKILPGIFQHGLKKTTEILTGGQSVFPQSIFYAGKELQPEIQSLLSHLKKLIGSSQPHFIDVHTGLGAFANESLIIDGIDPENSLQEIQFWSQCLQTSIIDPATDAKIYQAQGVLPLLIKRHWPRAHYIVQEFGTYPGLQILHALVRKDALQTRQMFFPESLPWQNACLQAGLLRFTQLVKRLSKTE